jgi:polyisoprenoid-binding protein YceI
MSVWAASVRICAVLAGACVVAPAARSQPTPYRLDADTTRVHVEVLHFGTSTIRARFDRITGSVSLDRATRAGELSIVIDTGSISTGLGLFDSVLRREDMLAVQAHPQAYFVAQRMDFSAEGQVRSVQGEFTFRGISRPLSLRAVRFACRPDAHTARERCGGDFEGELARSDFGITFGLPFVADRVRLQVQVEGVRD